MRKTPFTLTLILVLSMLLNVSSFAVYENGPQNTEYNRTNAQSYIGMYTTSPNSAYHYFTYPAEGGDCTNFASQVVRAGGMSMTAAVDNPGDSSWYYYGSSWGRGRSSSWTSATKFRTYWADVNGVGEKNAYQFRVYLALDFNDDDTWYDIWSYLEPGDIVQYVRTNDWATYHSQAVHRTSYENEEYKVSMGQHTSDSWKNLRNYVLGLSSETRVCLIKISANTFSSRSARNLARIASMSTNELAAEENRLNQTAPQTIAAEHEKWATIAMLKQKLVEHGKNSQTSYKTGITTNALLQFIRNRMENNTLFLLFVENAEDGLPKTLLSNECEKARTENIILTDFEKRVQEESENIYSLWNEYWSNIIQQTPPFYYE